MSELIQDDDPYMSLLYPGSNPDEQFYITCTIMQE